MMNRYFLYFLCLLPLKLYASSWQLNDDHSELFFSVDYLNVSEVTGRFKKLTGSVEFDEKGVPHSLELMIDASSLDTGHVMRDGHLKGAEFFQVKTHPYFHFSSTRFEKLDKGEFNVFGKLTIKNEMRPLSVRFSLTDEVVDTWGYKSRFVKFSSWIKRSDFKLNWNKTLLNEKFLVGDKVKIWGNFQLQPQQKMTPSSKHKIPDTSYIRSREKMIRGELPPKPEFSDLPEASSLKSPTLVNEIAQSSAQRARAERILVQPTITWWIALFTLGFMGFISVIVFGIQSKKILADYLSKKYTENGVTGHIVDFVVILFVMIYAVAFWIVGWGQTFSGSL